MRILIAIDSKAPSEAALQWGGNVAEAVGAPVTLLTVIRDEGGHPRAASVLEQMSASFLAGRDVAILILVGRPGEQILRGVDALQQEDSQLLLVLGSPAGRSLLRRGLAPAVERVLQHLPCPVVLVRGEARRPKRVLLAESGRDPSLLNRLMNQLQPVLAMAEAITVLHVMSQIAAGPGVDGWELRADAEELMREATVEGRILKEDLARLAQLHISTQAKVRHGLVVEEILTEAGSGDYDLIVIGSHQGTRWQRLLLDDLAREIIEGADRTVLVV